MAQEENGFMEYLELQDGKAGLVTMSELLSKVRDAGLKLSDRQLTFYTSQELIPHSVRAGSRAGVYPAIVVDLMVWLLYTARWGSFEALREAFAGLEVPDQGAFKQGLGPGRVGIHC